MRVFVKRRQHAVTIRRRPRIMVHSAQLRLKRRGTKQQVVDRVLPRLAKHGDECCPRQLPWDIMGALRTRISLYVGVVFSFTVGRLSY